MRPIDLYMERQIRDTRSDQQTSRHLLSESNSLVMLSMAAQMHATRRDQTHKGQVAAPEDGMAQRDKMALASIAFCSPLMLFGMGLTFSVMDDLKISRDARFKDSLRNKLQLRKADLDPNRQERSTLSSKPLSLSLDAASLRPGAQRKSPRADKMMFPPVRQERFWPKPEKSWLKASKLVKEKQAISDQLEKFRGQLSLGLASALVSRIEQLDKALKAMGC